MFDAHHVVTKTEVMGGDASRNSCPNAEDLAVYHDNRLIVPSIYCYGTTLWVSYHDVHYNYGIIWSAMQLPKRVVRTARQPH